MLHLCVTRFNNKTWKENQQYREKKKIEGCIYPSPTKIGPKLPLQGMLLVFEMNNDKNEIEGIGLIRNYLRMDKYYKVYSEGNYNRYTYQSPYRISRAEFTEEELKFCNMMEIIVFKGYNHIKRGQGIQQIPTQKLLNKIFGEKKLVDYARDMFISRYSI